MAKRKAKTQDASDVAKKIWLAGLGAYGRAFTEAQDQLEKIGKESSKLFDQLVEKGQELEGEANERIEKLTKLDPVVKFQDQAEKVTAKAEEVQDKSLNLVEERLEKLRENFGFTGQWLTLAKRIDEISDQLNTVSKDVAAIRKAVAPKSTRSATAKKKPSAKKAAKKKVAKKKTTTRRRKAA